MKNIKRVMAAEYSRELSAKVHAGQCRLSSLGFTQGGSIGYALHRELVDGNMQPKGLLRKGERKYLETDHVRLRPGSSDEVAVVRWIFHQFVVEGESQVEIARQLNRRAIPNKFGEPWNRPLIGKLLKNENYIGNIVYNRRSFRLKQKRANNPPHLWIRSEAAIEPIIEQSLFLQAQRLIKRRRHDFSEDEMLARLRATLKRRGRLSASIINTTVGRAKTYMSRFGTLRNAYRLVGYTTKRDCDFIDSGQIWTEAIAKLAHQVAAAIEKTGERLNINRVADCLLVNDNVGISFRIARRWPKEKTSYSPFWTIHRRKYLPEGWVVAIRLGESNKVLLDYLLLPTSVLVGRRLRFREKALSRYKVRRFETIDALIRSLIERTTRTGRASTKPARSKRPLTASLSTSKNGRAPR